MRRALPRFSFPLVFVATSLAAAHAGAQGRRLPVDAIRPSGHSLDFADGRLRAVSPSYKASFDRSGVRFTPTLGPAAPKNYPVRLQFASVRRGASVLSTGTGSDPRAAGDVVSLARGSNGSRDVVERYEIRDDEIEQSFVFRRKVVGRGDLLVRLRIDSELRAQSGERLESLLLTAPRVPGGVKIGAVTGVDARGRRCAGWMNYDGEHLDLVLPDDFVDTAAYPLVLDPVIGGIFSGGASFQDRRPDVAYDASNDYYLLVWEIQRSAADSDIWSTRLKSDNTGRSGAIIVSAPGIQSRPCIANIASTDMYMIVWQDNSSGNWDLRGRAIQASNRALSPIVTIAATSADEITPDLAGEVTSSDDDVVCVWDDEAVGIRAVEIEVKSPQSVTVGTPKTLAPGAAPANDNPAISKSGGAARRVAVVWESTPRVLAVQAHTMDLAPASTPLVLPLSNAFPDVDGDGTEFTIVFQRPESATSNLGDVWCWGVSAPAAANQPMRNRASPRPLASTPNHDEAHPTVSFVGTRFVAAWADRDSNTASGYRCHIQNLLPSCTKCGSAFRVTRSAGSKCDWPAIASHFSGGATRSDQAWVLFQQEDLQRTPPRSIVMVARYDAVAGGPIQSIASGCGGGGTFSIDGAFAFGETVTFRLRGADIRSPVGVYLAGFLGARTQVPCGPCRFLLGPIAVGLPLRGGAAQFAWTIPCDSTLLNFDLDSQIAVVAPTSPCPAIVNVSTSNILRARILD